MPNFCLNFGANLSQMNQYNFDYFTYYGIYSRDMYCETNIEVGILAPILSRLYCGQHFRVKTNF